MTSSVFSFLLLYRAFLLTVLLTVVAWVPATVSAAPVPLSSINTTGKSNANAVFVNGNYAYVGTENNSGLNPEFYIVQITSPSQPVLIGSLNVGADVTAITVAGNTAYLGTAKNGAQVTIVDITTKSQPAIVGRVALTRTPLAVTISGTTLYVGTTKNTDAGGRDFYVIDVATPAAPTVRGNYQVGADVHSIALSNITSLRAYLATSHDTNELVELDVANPAAITQAATYNAPGSADAFGVAYTSGKLALVTDDGGAQPDFYLLNVTLPTAVTQISALNLASKNLGVAIRGTTAVVATTVASQGVKVINFSSVTQPVVTATYNSQAIVEAVTFNGPHLYLATRHDAFELQVLDVNLPFRPDVRDVNGDGLISISCLGDSNTSIFFSNPKWCEGMEQLVLPPNVVVHNHGFGFATAVAVPDWPVDAFEQLADALAHDAPDVIIFAFGTNDVQLGYSTSDIVTAYQQLASQTQAVGALPLIALTPPVFPPVTDPDALNVKINELNTALKATFPVGSLIDFYGPMVFLDDYYTDGLHLNVEGQAKRAPRAYDRLIFVAE